MLDVNGMLDIAIADQLGVTVEEYIDKIEKTTRKRAEIIIFGLIEDDPLKTEKIKRIFKLIL